MTGRWAARGTPSREAVEAELRGRSAELTQLYDQLATVGHVSTPAGPFYATERGRRRARQKAEARRMIESTLAVGDEVLVRRADGAEVRTHVRAPPWSMGEEWVVGIWEEPRIVRLGRVRPAEREVLSCK